MSTKMLESSALSAYCESIAIMLSAGIQTEEAVHLLGENMQTADFKRACDGVYLELIGGHPLALSMQKTGYFPQHLIDMVAAGEFSGRLENTLFSLAKYYDEEDRLYAKIKSSVTYPAALLGVMTVILLFTVAVILPVFINVYQSLSGSLTAGSYSYVNVSIIVGWVALAITFLCTATVLCGMALARTQKGRLRLLGWLERTPITREPLRQMALGRFTSALATYTAAGIDSNTAIANSVSMVDHVALKKELHWVQQEMIDPDKVKSLAQAINDNNIYEPIYARMLTIGARSGSLEKILDNLSETFFEDSITRIDTLIDSVEPTLAAFLTISVGTALIAVMLPLIGIMGSIG